MKGRLTVVTGCMFSGKTAKLIETYQKTRGFKLQFKPIIDDRYGEEVITSHNGQSIPAMNIRQISDIYDYIEEGKLYTIFIDEIQFFERDSFLEDVEKILERGHSLFLAGLDYYSIQSYDEELEPFGATVDLYDQADVAIALLAACSKCDEVQAMYGRKVGGNQSTNIEIGGADLYEPLCEACMRELSVGV